MGYPNKLHLATATKSLQCSSAFATMQNFYFHFERSIAKKQSVDPLRRGRELEYLE